MGFPSFRLAQRTRLASLFASACRADCPCGPSQPVTPMRDLGARVVRRITTTGHDRSENRRALRMMRHRKQRRTQREVKEHQGR